MTAARKGTRSSAESIGQVLAAALELFSQQGFGATSMRQIAERSGLSVGNVYHHFANKEQIFERLLDQYWEGVTAPDLTLNQLFERANFPDDLEQLAAAIRDVVDRYSSHILLIYVDVIEFRGKHIRGFYEGMADRFEQTYGETLRRRADEFGDVNPLVAVMVATRWFFYFYTVERCFGVPMHFGMTADKAIDEFNRLIRLGLLPRSEPGNDENENASPPTKGRED